MPQTEAEEQNNSDQVDKGIQSKETDLWVERYGDALYRFALIRVQNSSVAEDLVQDAFVAALQAQSQFQGRSAELTWLTGILKHKIIDHLRKSCRFEGRVVALDHLDSVERSFDPDRHFHWKVPVHRWPKGPDSQAETKELRGVLEKCLEKLGDPLRQIFLLKELDNMKAEDLCKHFGLTATNLWVTLHRIRHKLRNCMEKNWFKIP